MSDRGRPLVVVLGASGFVGSALVAKLVARRVRLRLVARRPSPVPCDAPRDVDVRRADLAVPGQVAEAVAGADVVINLLLHGDWRTATNGGAVEKVNCGVVGDIVQALRAERRPGPPPVVLFAGSTSQVGRRVQARIDGTEPDDPETPYDRQKLAAERVLAAATAQGVVRGVTLRLPTVFGAAPAADRGVVAVMARRALAGEPLTMWGDGGVERDLLYVGDAAEAFLAALGRAHALAGRHWLVGTGRGTSVRHLFTAIAEIASAYTGAEPVPVISTPPPDGATLMDPKSVVADPAAFHRRTGWTARVPLDEALRRTVSRLAGQRV
ncbi:NAD-dependent epimerase/dehydratase family protein [Sphaerisporangium sp. NPDC049003]|uniref:NAD-dependent epimerase/dehydratase family protein n=1 Tax=Sphaerisporangium sp. NPDC049003 TaxID=3364517 RepID=UPI00371DEBBE